MAQLTRRDFLKLSGAAGLALALSELDLRLLEPIIVDNPLADYPARDWEKVYRDQYRYDSTFTYVCSPNDTHACRLRAFVRNGVILRSETNYDVANYGDLYGNKATAHWHPRGRKKGQTFHRRMYGPHRLWPKSTTGTSDARWLTSLKRASAEGVCRRVQHQPLYRLPGLHRRVQGHLDVL